MRYHVEIDEEQQEEIARATLEQAFMDTAKGVCNHDHVVAKYWGVEKCEALAVHLYESVLWFTEPGGVDAFKERMFKMPVE